MVEPETLEGFKDWPQMKPSDHPSTQPQKTQLRKTQSMVVVRESINNNDLSIFPPINHENLHTCSHHNQNHQSPISPLSSSSSSSSSLPFSPSTANVSEPPSPRSQSPPFEYRVPVAKGWCGFGLEVLRVKICRAASSFGYKGNRRAAVWSFGPAAGVAAVFMVWWLFTRLRLRRWRREGLEHLMVIIKEKDEKITQLLHQISQMNELLLAHHRIITSKLAD